MAATSVRIDRDCLAMLEAIRKRRGTLLEEKGASECREGGGEGLGGTICLLRGWLPPSLWESGNQVLVREDVLGTKEQNPQHKGWDFLCGRKKVNLFHIGGVCGAFVVAPAPSEFLVYDFFNTSALT